MPRVWPWARRPAGSCVALRYDPEGSHGAPFSSGEVGDVDALATVGDRPFAEGADYGPDRAVVDVLIEWFPIAEAGHDAPVHDEVHAAMSAVADGFFGEFFPERVVVFLVPLTERGALHPALGGFGLAFDDDPSGEAGPHAARALDKVVAGVGAGELFIPLDHQGLAFDGFADGGVDVTADEFKASAFVSGREFSAGVFGACPRRAADAGHEVEPVSPVDIHVVGDGAEAVGGIEIPVPLGVVVGAPGSGSVFDLLHLPAKIVDVGGFSVEEFAEQSEAAHMEDEELFTAVVDVLEHHAVSLGFFGNVHDGPEVFDGVGEGDFDERVLAAAHGVDGHAGVVFPGGADVDDVNIVALEHPLVIVRAVGKENRSGFAGVGAHLAAFFSAGDVGVAHRDDFNAFENEAVGEVGRATGTHADEAHTHAFEGIGA